MTTDTEEKNVQYTDGSHYEVPRPFLTLEQAARILGKSMRSLERSLVGRWGNKLPEGWVARKIRTTDGEEWKILPPAGFRVNTDSTASGASALPERWEGVEEDHIYLQAEEPPQTQKGKQPKRKVFWRQSQQAVDRPTIVIDRSEEIELLLRELVSTQRSLAEERRHHMEDMRLIQQLQGSVRLLEVDAAEKQKAKSNLENTQLELKKLQEQYEHLLNTPWWKRLFRG